MARKTKHDIEVKIIYDKKEKDIDYTKLLLDKRIGSDGVKFIEVERETVKPLDVNTNLPCKISTGDITFYYREKDTQEEWRLTNFCCEIKKNSDMFQSLYMKANRDRLLLEIQRSYDYGLQLYFVSTEDLTTLSKTIHKIPKFRLTAVENTHFEQFMQLQDKLKECGYNGVIVSGTDLAWVIRRCIKHYIKKNKIQYW